MKNNNKNNFFIKKNSNFWFFFIPLAIIVLLSIGTFIATSWYNIDYQIAEEFAKGLKFEFAKYWTRFYDQLGMTELFIIIIIYITIILETWFLTKIKNKKKYWIVDSYYIIVLIIWITANLITIILISNTDYGFGKGIDYKLIDDIKYQLTGTIAAFILQTIMLLLGLYYVRYHLVKKARILAEQFWLKAVKGLSFLALTYIVIATLKGTTARLYYYNAIFGDLYKNLPNQWKEIYLKSDFQYGYNRGQGYIDNIPWDLQYPWWKPTLGLIHSDANMPRFSLPVNYAFPSGHINATYCTGSAILLFLKNKTNNRVNWKIKLLFVIWLIHVLSMNFALIVERFHWMSDTSFTFIFSTLMILVIHFSINKIFVTEIK